VGAFAACALIVLLLGPTHYLVKTTILIVYLVGCVLLSVITVADMSMVFAEIFAIVSRIVRRQRVEDSA